MSFLEIDVLEGKRFSVANSISQQFSEIEEIHFIVGEHDLLVETNLEGSDLLDLMYEIKSKVKGVGYVNPLFVLAE
ncbi:hypothetical protein HY500_03390 [Candidatus Woesearchaeota archaeon]|nr:hypothetical protein [Candidatus Woesearchaeota archaeon]